LDHKDAAAPLLPRLDGSVLGRESFECGRTKIGVACSLGGTATGGLNGWSLTDKHWHDGALQQLKQSDKGGVTTLHDVDSTG